MSAIRYSALTLILLAGASRVWADDPPPPMDVWAGKGQLGFLDSQGNTVSESLNAALDMTRVDGPWKNALVLLGLYGRSGQVVSAERYDGRWQTNYDLSPTIFTFGAAHYEHDMFSGFQYQADGSAGLGYKIFNTDKTKLTAQVGVGYQWARPELLETNADGEVEYRVPLASTDNVIATAGLDFSQGLSKSTTLSNKFLTEIGSADTVLHDQLALTVKMSTKLALSLGYQVQDNTNPPVGVKKLDTVATANLVYAFP